MALSGPTCPPDTNAASAAHEKTRNPFAAGILREGEPIEKTYVPDFYCYGKIIVEIKAVESLAKEHRSQLLNYLRLTGSKLGLLVNFCAYPKAVIEQWAN